jgi:pimeloyl-ACP methyl ester carboxylesterase
MTDTAAAAHVPGTEGFERREIDLYGVKTVYFEAGEGPTAVYFHGGSTFHGFQWALALAERFRVICPHHPGFGASDDDPRIGGMEHYVLHYLDFFDALKLGKVHLAGASMGGRLAAEFAIGHSDRLKSLVLCSPAGLDIPEHTGANPMGMSVSELVEHLVEDLAVMSPYTPPVVPEAVFVERIQREGMAAGKAMMSPTGLDHWLHRITVPTLLVWGEKDKVLPVGRAKTWAEKLPKAEVKIIPGAGHATFDESPESVRIIGDFMAGV